MKNKLFIILFFFASWVHGQKVAHYTNETMSIDGAITSIVIDKNGNKWIGSEFGLVKFDGKNWRVFSTKDGLPKGGVGEIAVDKNGFVWVVIEDKFYSEKSNSDTIIPNGLSMYNGTKWESVNFSNGLLDNYIRSICCDINKNVWVATRKGLCKYNNGKWSKFHYTKDLPFTDIKQIVSDGKGLVYVDASIDSSYSEWFIFKYEHHKWSKIGKLRGNCIDFKVNKFGHFFTVNYACDEYGSDYSENISNCDSVNWESCKSVYCDKILNKNIEFDLKGFPITISGHRNIHSLDSAFYARITIFPHRENNIFDSVIKNYSTKELVCLLVEDSKFRNEVFSLFPYEYVDFDFFTDSDEYCPIAVDKNGSVWIGTKNGVYVVPRKKLSIKNQKKN